MSDPLAPYRPAQVVAWAGVNLTAAAVLAACWWRASGTSEFRSQRVDIAVGVVAVAAAAAAGVRLFRAGRRTTLSRRAALLADAPARRATARPATGPAQGLVAGPGLRRFHRADCPFAAGRHWPQAGRAEHRAEGRAPCGVCRP